MRTTTGALLAAVACAAALAQAPRFTPVQEKLADNMGRLRTLDLGARGTRTRALALEIRARAPSDNKRRLAAGLATLSIEGDFGRGTLQQVTTTLAQATTATPPPAGEEMPGLERLQRQFGPQGLVIVGISDENQVKAKPFECALRPARQDGRRGDRYAYPRPVPGHAGGCRVGLEFAAGRGCEVLYADMQA